MADLELALSWLDMSQYLERFLQAGFDSWETVLDITENDLEVLNVEMGHRKKLQKEIANSSMLAGDPPSITPSGPIPHVQATSQMDSGSLSSNNPLASSGKRGYRHHPRPDPNAPKRPYSAYVLFSNMVRDDLRVQLLSFAELSRRVGDRWQSLSTEQKEVWKQKAAEPLEKYNIALTKYQKSEEGKEYRSYLLDFRSTQPAKKINAKVLKPATSRTTSSLSATYSTTSLYPPGELRSEDTKIAISRIRRESDVGKTTAEGPRPPRTNHACELCRQKRTKCPGERPFCSKCQNMNLVCVYPDTKRVEEKRTVDDLWKKARMYEALLRQCMPQVREKDRSAIQDSLQAPPHLENYDQIHNLPQSTSPDHGDEDAVSGVGSMGSTGHANEEDFAKVEHTGLPQAFVGQSTEDKWVQRLEEELSDADRDRAPSQANFAAKDKIQNFGANLYPGEVDASIVGSQTDPYGIPLKSTADALINTYFTSIHPSFPIINEIDFRNEYHEYLTLLIPEKSNDRTFRTILQMVFAIGAVHAHMIQTEWTGDDRDHLRYFTRAQALGVGIGVLNNLVFHEQVQIFGLGAMYFMVTDQLNRQVTEIPSKYLVLIARPRAWNALGLAIRSAQALGMHLQNTTPTLTDMEIETRVRMWHSILSLEHAINVMTGRPSMVHDKDCNVPLPSLNPQEALSQKAKRSAEPYTVSSLDDRGSSGPSSTFLSDRTFSLISVPPFKTPIWVVYFRYFVELQALAEQVMTRLYNPQIRKLKWSEIHGQIREMDDELIRWARSLPTPFNILEPSLDMQYEPYRVAIGVLFNSTRATINRPCLCRIDRKLSNQSSHSIEKSQESASRCVHSARAILGYLSDEPNLEKDHFGLLWWMLQHHLKRATTVLLLELAFRSVHMPSEAEDILIDAHKAIKWLRALASFSTASKRCWTNLSRLLQLAAQKIGRNASEIVTSDFLQQTSPSSHNDFYMAEPFFPSRDQAVPLAWDPMGYDGEDPRDQREPLGGLTTHELDQFGFLQNLGLSSMFPTVGEDGGPTEGEYNEATQAHGFFWEPTG